jgi:hypothetical protein
VGWEEEERERLRAEQLAAQSKKERERWNAIFRKNLDAVSAADARVQEAYAKQEVKNREWNLKQEEKDKAFRTRMAYDEAVRKVHGLRGALIDKSFKEWLRRDDKEWSTALTAMIDRLLEIEPKDPGAADYVRVLEQEGTSPLPRRMLAFQPLMYALIDFEEACEEVRRLLTEMGGKPHW